MRIYYTVSEPEFDDYLQAEISGNVNRFVAENVAEDYFDNHGGWECNWDDGIVFYIWSEEKELLGTYRVFMEAVPSFSATSKI